MLIVGPLTAQPGCVGSFGYRAVRPTPEEVLQPYVVEVGLGIPKKTPGMQFSMTVEGGTLFGLQFSNAIDP